MTREIPEFSKSVIAFILEYIDERLPNPVSIHELQEKSGYSKRHLGRLFILYTGVCPSVYLKTMQMYRLLIEFKMTSISVMEACKKYNIKDPASLKKKFRDITGLEADEVKQRASIHLDNILMNNKIKFNKKYESCTFVSLFDYRIRAKGVRHSFLRNSENILSTHYYQIDNIVSEFCAKYHFQRNAVWTCVKFTPFNSEQYEVVVFPCIFNPPTEFAEGENLSLQGDYLCFTWRGREADSFPNVKNIYDNFLLRHMAIRKDGFDIVKRQQLNGVGNYYIYAYYIPVIINESITDLLSG